MQLDPMRIQEAFANQPHIAYVHQCQIQEPSLDPTASFKNEESPCRPARDNDNMLTSSSWEAGSPLLNHLNIGEIGRDILKSAESTESIENWSPVLPEDVTLPLVAGMAPFDPIAEG